VTPPLVYVAGAIDYAERGDHNEAGPAHVAEF
jgi:hypothetical protein